MALDLINPRINFSPSYQFDDIGVIHDRRRIVVKNVSNKNLMELESVNRKELKLDPFSGHLRLLLEISEISYSAVLATHYVGSKIGAGRTHFCHRQGGERGNRFGY